MDEKHWKDPSPWVPMKEPIDQKHCGKLLEELGECVEAAIMFTDNPELHRVRLENEIADVLCGATLFVEHFNFPTIKQASEEAEGVKPALSGLVSSLGDTIAAVARVFIQGVAECEPVSKMPNRLRIECAFSRLMLRISVVGTKFNLDHERMNERVEFKKRHLRAWHQMLA